MIHADIPGSLENYLQEAGRAGRDRAPACCVLLYTTEDTERQFGLSARSRLTQKEIGAILKSLRTLERKKHGGGQVVATTGEILREEEEGNFQRDFATDDTRVKTAVSWLEEAELLSREENRVQVFPSSLRVPSVQEAAAILARRGLTKEEQKPLLAIVGALINADPDEGMSTDELMALAGLSSEKLRKVLYDLETLGIASNDTKLTAFVHVAVERSSQKRLDEAVALETALIALLRESAHDLSAGDSSVLHLRHACQKLRDGFPHPPAPLPEGEGSVASRSATFGTTGALPEKIVLLLKGLAEDGRNEDGGKGGLNLRRLDAESVSVKLQREWGPLEEGMLARHKAAGLILRKLLAGPGSGKTRVLVHRLAYLVRVKRETPHGIAALAYNRHAAVEIRRRLFDLIGDDARGVTVLTCDALAGRSLADEDSRLNLFAVGDDDQNIYAFNGASVDYIRRFGTDYEAQPAYLTQNYRSTRHIIELSNRMIEPAASRMKADHSVRIDRRREKDAPGSPWQKRDPVGQGRVQILPAGPDRFLSGPDVDGRIPTSPGSRRR